MRICIGILSGLFILNLGMGMALAGTSGDIPKSLNESLLNALATNDAFVINATFNAAAEQYPMLQPDIDALRAKNQEVRHLVQPEPEIFKPATLAKIQKTKPQSDKIVNGDDALPKPKAIWAGEVTAAYDKQSGNTKTENIMLAYNVERETGNWRHKSDGRIRFASEDGNTINEDYRVKLGSDWKFDENLFVFGEAEYVADEFSGFDYRVTESVGLGSRWKWNNGKSFFDVRSSVGGRHLKGTEAGAKVEHNGILKPALELGWHISDRIKFNQKASSTIGTDVTITETQTSFDYIINSRLALKLGFQVEHTSSVPVGTKKTETYTSTGISYKLFE